MALCLFNVSWKIAWRYHLVSNKLAGIGVAAVLRQRTPNMPKSNLLLWCGCLEASLWGNTPSPKWGCHCPCCHGEGSFTQQPVACNILKKLEQNRMITTSPKFGRVLEWAEITKSFTSTVHPSLKRIPLWTLASLDMKQIHGWKRKKKHNHIRVAVSPTLLDVLASF